MHITTSPFGQLADGRAVSLFTLTNDQGIQVKITDFGGIITELHVPDRQGNFADVVLGYDDLDGYVRDKNYFGAVIGRYANRVADASFELDGTRYGLDRNDGANHLHGGSAGFYKVLWSAQIDQQGDYVALILSYRSVDGEQGYPGNLDVTVTYQLNQRNELRVQYQALTDKATPVNLTQHSYFNLAGAGAGNRVGGGAGVNAGEILSHELMIDADAFTPVNPALIPEAGHVQVAGTPFDFRAARLIAEQIDGDDRQLRLGKGYDHNFVLNKTVDNQLNLAARVVEPVSGRVLELITQEPGLQFYSGNFLDGSVAAKGLVYGQRSGFCLEPQHFPDSPNRPVFPSTILRPDERYLTVTIYRFSVQA